MLSLQFFQIYVCVNFFVQSSVCALNNELINPDDLKALLTQSDIICCCLSEVNSPPALTEVARPEAAEMV